MGVLQYVSSNATIKLSSNLPWPQSEPGARAANYMRLWRHRSHAADQTRLRFAELNHLRAGNDRLDAAAAESIHGQRGTGIRNTRFQRNMSRAVNRVTGSLQRVADDCVINLSRSYARCFERGFRGDRAEID